VENEIIEQQPGIGLSAGRAWIILAAVLLAAIIATFTLARPIAKIGAARPEAASYGEFKSPLYAFTLKYPLSWRSLGAKEPARSKELFAFAARHDRPNAFFSVRVQTTDPKNVKLAQVAKVLDKRLAEKFRDFQKIDAKVIALDSGRKALLYDYYFASKQQTKMRERIVIIPSGTRVFHLTTWAGAEDFKSLGADIDAMVKSFSWK